MESVLRRFGLKKGEQRESEARQKLQRDLFAFSRVCLHVKTIFFSLYFKHFIFRSDRKSACYFYFLSFYLSSYG